MAAKKYLKNLKNGVVLAYSKRLEKNHPHCVVVESDGTNPDIEEVDADEEVVVGSSLDIGKAKKAELVAFADKFYGVELDQSATVPALRKQVVALVEQE